MSYDRKFSPKIILLITLLVIVIVVAISIIAVSVVNYQWGLYEIFTFLGTFFFVAGGIVAMIRFAGGTTITNVYLHSRYYKMAKVDNEYSIDQRKKFPWLVTILLIIGGIFLAIGLSGIF